MAVAANALNVVGLVFLSHAYGCTFLHVRPTLTFVPNSVYSAYEFSLLPRSPITTPAAADLSIPGIVIDALNPKISIPLDITLELVFSIVLLCIGVVLSSPDLKPIQWNVWAGHLERSAEARKIKEVGVGGGDAPYKTIEERSGFLDIRRARAEFEQWFKARGKSVENAK
jgi:hypothetical protein